jgi:dTDP-4-amino-4,6-dideoxygalactose transaminase
MKYLKEKGVETTIMFRPVHMQPYFKSRFNIQNRYPNAELVGTNSLVLPLHVGMTTEDIDYVLSALKSFKK